VSAPHRHHPGPGSPMALIHGVGSGPQVWDHLAPALSERHDVLSIDVPGLGAAPLDPSQPVTLAGMTDSVEAALDEAGFDTAHVVGNSMGGRIGIELVRRGRARSLVGLSPAGFGLGCEQAYARVSLRATRSVARVIAPWANTFAAIAPLRIAFAAGMFGRPTRIEAKYLVEGTRTLARAERLVETVRATISPIPRLDTDVPILIAWGTRDRLLLPRQASRVRVVLPSARLVWLTRMGHVPMPDDPAQVGRLVLEWAAAVDEGRTTARPRPGEPSPDGDAPSG
jgi:pimeloyl-ACP methyl ester carboxylesterase